MLRSDCISDPDPAMVKVICSAKPTAEYLLPKNRKSPVTRGCDRGRLTTENMGTSPRRGTDRSLRHYHVRINEHGDGLEIEQWNETAGFDITQFLI